MSEELLTQALLCHKEPARLPKLSEISILGGYFLPYADSLWHKGSKNRTFPYMEATYPLCHKEPARLWMPELVLYGIRELAEQHYEPLNQ